MNKSKNSTEEWFIKWSKIIRESREISRLQLSEKSGASLWTIKALTKDFLEWDAFIIYDKNKFRVLQYGLEKSLSTLSEFQKESMK